MVFVRRAPKRTLFQLFSDDVNVAKAWYVDLFGYTVAFETNSSVLLRAHDNEWVELEIVRRNHSAVPAAFRGRFSGGTLTVEVDDLDRLHRQAQSLVATVLEPPHRLTGRNQRRLLLEDPDGVLVTVLADDA